MYGAAKTFNEGLLRSFRAMHGLDHVLLRYFNVYGPRMDVHGLYTEVLVRWMERIADGLPPLIFGDGLQTMDFVYTTDIARANVLAAASDVREGVYNVARGEETSLLELAQTLLRVDGLRPARRARTGPRRQRRHPPPRRHVGRPTRPRLRRRGRARGRPARARRVVAAAARPRWLLGRGRGSDERVRDEPDQRDAAVARRGGGRRGRRGDPLRLGGPGTAGRRVRVAFAASPAGARTPWR